MTLLTKGIKDLNQDLFNPPNIAGWPTGRDWIGGQLIEKRITKLTKFSVTWKQPQSKLNYNYDDEQKYNKRLQEFFETAQKDQLAFEMIAIDWIAEDFGKRRWNDTNISFYNVRLNGNIMTELTLDLVTIEMIKIDMVTLFGWSRVSVHRIFLVPTITGG